LKEKKGEFKRGEAPPGSLSPSLLKEKKGEFKRGEAPL